MVASFFLPEYVIERSCRQKYFRLLFYDWHTLSSGVAELKMDQNPVPFLINAALNIPFCLVAVAGNSLVLASFAKNHSLISPSNVILIGLAVSDLCVGVIVQPLYIVWRFNQFFSKENWGKGILDSLTLFLSCALCSFSFLTVTTLSVDRYLALRLHLRYRELITVRRVSFFLGFACMSAFSLCTMTVFLPAHDEYIASVMALAFFVINTIIYFKIYCVVRRHRREITVQQRHQPEQLHTSRIPVTRFANILRLRNSFLDTFYVYLIFLCCYIPYISIAIIFPEFKTNSSLVVAFEISWSLVFINSSLNPLLYSWRIKGVRATMKTILLGSSKRQSAPSIRRDAGHSFAMYHINNSCEVL